MQMTTRWRRHIVRRLSRSIQIRTILHRLARHSRKSMQPWHVFLMRRNVECTIRLEMWTHSKRKNLTQVVAVVLDILASGSDMLIKSSYRQKTSSTSCSLVKNLNKDKQEDTNRHSIITNIANKLVEVRGMPMKVNCYFVNLVHSSFSLWWHYLQAFSAVVSLIREVHRIRIPSNVPTNSEKSLSPTDSTKSITFHPIRSVTSSTTRNWSLNWTRR